MGEDLSGTRCDGRRGRGARGSPASPQGEGGLGGPPRPPLPDHPAPALPSAGDLRARPGKPEAPSTRLPAGPLPFAPGLMGYYCLRIIRKDLFALPGI